jgi:hypothetical protein
MKLREELAQERDDLSGLIIETRAVIGRVARQGYRALNRIPGSSPVTFPAGGMYGDHRFFKSVGVIRRVELPNGPVDLPDDEFSVTGTQTMTYRREHGSPLVGRVWPLPARRKQVEVELSHPNRPTQKIGVTNRGTALYNGRSDHLLPRWSWGFDTSYGEHVDYSNVGDLRADYAGKYSAALAVTNLVTTGLAEVHGIECDTTMLDPLAEAWQRVSPEDVGTATDVTWFLRRDRPEA